MRFALPVLPDDAFLCEALRCSLRGRVCVARQLESERELRGDWGPRSSRRKRGVAPELIHCVTARCAQGRAIRAALGDDAARFVRRGERDPTPWRDWLRAHLEPNVPTLDEPPFDDA